MYIHVQISYLYYDIVYTTLRENTYSHVYSTPQKTIVQQLVSHRTMIVPIPRGSHSVYMFFVSSYSAMTTVIILCSHF